MEATSMMEQAEKIRQGASAAGTGEPPRERRRTLSEAGDTDSERFVRLVYDEHGSALIRFAARLLGGDRLRAEDILQEAAIRAWRHIGLREHQGRTESGRGSSPSCATW
ncbi:sigma factor [Streptomyces sp. NPDC093586]|uniref:sigma factor n=1 Tax=Streptomyces sp. NPDC093586 TaxID=3366042 RepID=UPI00381867E5